MQISSRAFGFCVTNCYVLDLGGAQVAIDPGDGACEWVAAAAPQLRAIFLTHGHFDHDFDAAALRERTGAPIYCPRDDAFMCRRDPFGYLKNPFAPDVLVAPGERVSVGGAEFVFHHFAGHTPGCSMIEAAGGVVFSGDFLFKGSVGRFDFPFSDREAMRASLARVGEFRGAMGWEGDFVLHSGHGESTTLSAERGSVKYWAQFV